MVVDPEDDAKGIRPQSRAQASRSQSHPTHCPVDQIRAPNAKLKRATPPLLWLGRACCASSHSSSDAADPCPVTCKPHISISFDKQSHFQPTRCTGAISNHIRSAVCRQQLSWASKVRGHRPLSDQLSQCALQVAIERCLALTIQAARNALSSSLLCLISVAVSSSVSLE